MTGDPCAAVREEIGGMGYVVSGCALDGQSEVASAGEFPCLNVVRFRRETRLAALKAVLAAIKTLEAER